MSKINPSLDFHTEAKRIFDIIQSAGQPIAVFNIDDQLVTIPKKGGKFEAMYRDFPRKLVGVYNSACTLGMIKEDLL